jgi:hypothetical protein
MVEFILWPISLHRLASARFADSLRHKDSACLFNFDFNFKLHFDFDFALDFDLNFYFICDFSLTVWDSLIWITDWTVGQLLPGWMGSRIIFHHIHC